MIIERVKELIADQLGLSASEISDNADLIKDLNADSLDLVQMLISLEKEFSISFNFDEIKSLQTIKDVVKFIEERKK